MAQSLTWSVSKEYYTHIGQPCVSAKHAPVFPAPLFILILSNILNCQTVVNYSVVCCSSKYNPDLQQQQLGLFLLSCTNDLCHRVPIVQVFFWWIFCLVWQNNEYHLDYLSHLWLNSTAKCSYYTCFEISFFCNLRRICWKVNILRSHCQIWHWQLDIKWPGFVRAFWSRAWHVKWKETQGLSKILKMRL